MITSIVPLGGSSVIVNQIQNTVNEINNFYTEVTEATGFVDPDASEMSFNNGNRTFTIQPVVDSFIFWAFGNRYEKTQAESVQISDIDGLWYIYYDSSGVLGASQTIWNLSTQVPVASVLWDTGTGTTEPSKNDSKPSKFLDIYIIGVSIPGVLTNAQVVCLHCISGSETVELRKNLPYSIIKCGTAPTGSSTFTIYVNGVSKGTASIAGAATTGSFTFNTKVTLSPGDLVKIVGPTTADSTLADVAITLQGIRI